MAKVRIEVSYAGVGQLLHSEEMAGIVRQEAENVRSRCGDGYETDTYQAGSRVIASCYTATESAAKDNVKNNTLLRAIGG